MVSSLHTPDEDIEVEVNEPAWRQWHAMALRRSRGGIPVAALKQVKLFCTYLYGWQTLDILHDASN